jgi:hypothetical protein
MPQPDSLFSKTTFAAGCLGALPAALRASGALPPDDGHTVPADFLGVCVAASDAPAGDDFTIDRLRQAGLRHVRLDIAYGYETSPSGRLLRRLTDEGYTVWLHLVQPFEEARKMPEPDALNRWTLFVRSVFYAWRGRVAVFEAGSTCNRRTWTGYREMDAFLQAWRAAVLEARSAGVVLAGVNVTDFEPVYNAGLLEILHRHDLLPAIHSDNLFAERATEPERYDPKILGPRLSGVLRFNLVRKARLLAALARGHGIRDTVCTHTAWSARRIRRLLEDADGKQADYLARYLLLAAASGALSRVYWGPLIGQREGLIDDGTQEYPEPIPHVTFYGRVPGDPTGYIIRPAFHALRTLASFLPGAVWSRSLSVAGGVELLEFRTPGGLVHAGWTRNGTAADLTAVYAPGCLASVRVLDRDGRTMACPDVLTESPVYLFWDYPSMPSLVSMPSLFRNLTVLPSLGRRHKPVNEGGWVGFVSLPETAWPADGRLDRLMPESLESGPGRDVLRQARNTVWSMAHPFAEGDWLVIKRACAGIWYKRLLSLFQPSKARRSWNSACELERRGIATPAPVAFFERPVRHAALVPSYYVCRRFPGSGSVRSAFTAFAAGAAAFEGLAKGDFYRALAAFIGNLHERGVYHRDLSAGNVLATVRDGRAVFGVIDTGRARFYAHPLPLNLRLADLKRLCHPLAWPERETFVSLYLAPKRLAFTRLLKLPFALYDWKHRIKKLLRPLRGK